GTIMDGVIDAIWRRPSGGRLAVVVGNGISRDYWEVEELNNGELHREVERARGSTLVSARKLYTCHGPRGETRSVPQMLDLALEFNQLLRPGPGRRKGHAANKYCQVRLGSIVARSACVHCTRPGRPPSEGGSETHPQQSCARRTDPGQRSRRIPNTYHRF